MLPSYNFFKASGSLNICQIIPRRVVHSIVEVIADAIHNASTDISHIHEDDVSNGNANCGKIEPIPTLNSILFIKCILDAHIPRNALKLIIA